MSDTISADEYNDLIATKKLPKYRNVRTTVDGRTYDSKAEARRSAELLWRVQAGEITDLEFQPTFPLRVNGRHICEYRGDFGYIVVATGERVIEDVKSASTRVNRAYRIKKKLMRALYDIEITEVEM